MLQRNEILEYFLLQIARNRKDVTLPPDATSPDRVWMCFSNINFQSSYTSVEKCLPKKRRYKRLSPVQRHGQNLFQRVSFFPVCSIPSPKEGMLWRNTFYSLFLHSTRMCNIVVLKIVFPSIWMLMSCRRNHCGLSPNRCLPSVPVPNETCCHRFDAREAFATERKSVVWLRASLKKRRERKKTTNLHKAAVTIKTGPFT